MRRVEWENASQDRVIRVFLLDDHELVRVGVRDLLEAQPDIRVIGEAGTVASALARIPALRPDVAVLDMRLPGQERRILELNDEGLTNRQIGERMFLAEKTVKNYVSAVFQKLGMERRTQAAAFWHLTSSRSTACRPGWRHRLK
jgi:DNA-binding NarL/FixJ family response regulator